MELAKALDVRKGVTAIIGAGGKTTLLLALARELAQAARVIVTTTTHIYPPDDFPCLAELADYVLVEADGAHGRPAKAHADYEPVVPPEANQTILVFGLSALGQPIRACVHRPAIFAARCGVSEDDLLTPELAATFINDETPHTRVLLNQADTAERLALGRGMAAMLRGPVCLGTFRRSG